VGYEVRKGRKKGGKKGKYERSHLCIKNNQFKSAFDRLGEKIILEAGSLVQSSSKGWASRFSTENKQLIT